MASGNRLLYLSIIAASIAYFYSIYTRHSVKETLLEQVLLDSWKEIIHEPSRHFERILVGINCNVDLIVSGTKLLSHLDMAPALPVDHEDIRSAEQFREAFTLFFSRGAPGERYTSNEELFSTLARVAEMDMRPSEFAIGGNAALIADKLASNLNAQVLLVGPIGPRLKSLLHPAILTQNSAQMTKDEIHLILEFKQGDQWGDYLAQSSSRFITSHDTFSSSSAVIDMFFNSVISYKPDLIVLSGLHLLEFQNHDVRVEKLNVIQRRIREISSNIPIHLELGSMAEVDFGRLVMEKIVPYVDSLGLNEQEMIFASRVGNGPFADHFPVRATSIQAYKATEIMHWLLTSYGRNADDHRSDYRLQRIHFHCLTYHMSATVDSAWSNGEAALAAGARLAGKQACDGKGASAEALDPSSVELRIGREVIVDKKKELTFSPSMGLASWTRDTFRFMFTPVLVCKNPRKTVGLGDAISATGLRYSQFEQPRRP